MLLKLPHQLDSAEWTQLVYSSSIYIVYECVCLSVTAFPGQAIGPMALIICIRKYLDSRFSLQLDSIGETVALPHVTASRLVAASESNIVDICMFSTYPSTTCAL